MRAMIDAKEEKIRKPERAKHMKVVVIQSIPETMDLSREEILSHWEKLQEIPGVELEIKFPKPRMTRADYAAYIADADACIGAWIRADWLDEAFLLAHPRLRYLAVLGHGYEEFDHAIMQKHGVTITNTIYGDVTIAQYAMALLLDICHGIGAQSAYAKEGYFREPGARFNKLVVPQIELYQKTMGIVGLGAIGYQMAKMAAGFGMHIVAYSRHAKVGEKYAFVEQVPTLSELLRRSDVISLHCPYTAENARMLDARAFAQMKNGVILLNTARGGLIDEAALLDALNRRKVYAAGLDVLTVEPPTEQTPLLRSPYTRVTGHIAWLSREARLRDADIAIENFRAYLAGHPQSVIS